MFIKFDLTVKDITSMLLSAAVFSSGLFLAGCNGLSSEAKEMVGDYYNIELSETEPVMELNANGKCVLRAIKPGVLTYTVDGRWNVENDTLFISTDGMVDEAKGDTTLIGRVAEKMAKAVVNYNGLTLTLRSDGNDYVYTRRVKK